jgi:ankyrin repeat protein
MLKSTTSLLFTTSLLLLSLSFIGCSRTAEDKSVRPDSSQSNKNAAAPNAVESPGQAKGTDGNTPLLSAVNKGDTVEVRRLVEAGADVNAANDSGVTPLMNAAGMGNKEAVEFLIQKGANVNHRTSGNYTPLMQAALVGKTEIVKILLDAGADPAVKDTGGRTAITYAEDQKHDDIVQLIKEKMAPQSAAKKK